MTFEGPCFRTGSRSQGLGPQRRQRAPLGEQEPTRSRHAAAPRLSLHRACQPSPNRHNQLPEHLSLNLSKEVAFCRAQGTFPASAPCPDPFLRAPLGFLVVTRHPFGLGLGVGPGLSPREDPSALPQGSGHGWSPATHLVHCIQGLCRTGWGNVLLLHVKQQGQESGPTGHRGGVRPPDDKAHRGE